MCLDVDICALYSTILWFRMIKVGDIPCVISFLNQYLCQI